MRFHATSCYLLNTNKKFKVDWIGYLVAVQVMIVAPESHSAPFLVAVAAVERFDNLRRMLLLALAPAPHGHRWRIGLGRLALLVFPGGS